MGWAPSLYLSLSGVKTISTLLCDKASGGMTFAHPGGPEKHQ